MIVPVRAAPAAHVRLKGVPHDEVAAHGKARVGLRAGDVDEVVLPAVRDGGRVATVRGYRGNGERGVEVTPVAVRRAAEDREKLDRLRQQAEDGVVTLRVAQTFPAEEASAAHRRLAEGGVRGRLVLEF